MDNNTTNSSSSSPSKKLALCTAACGFFGNEAFNNMCSKCFKETNNKNKDKVAFATLTKESTTPATNASSLPTVSPSLPTTNTTVAAAADNVNTSTPTLLNLPLAKDDTLVVPGIEKSRKHLRSPSPDDPKRVATSAPGSSIASPAPQTPDNIANAPSDNNSKDKPVQNNKGRCFKCRLKVPLAKQAANKCRCSYVFCDSHRYPDRHDCDIDYAKMDREILAKNNPKLHERPRGGRSFQRIDSL